jgi:hypothetical protein
VRVLALLCETPRGCLFGVGVCRSRERPRWHMRDALYAS